MKIVVQTLSYKSSWARMFLWLTSGVSPAARTWLIATAISVGLKGSKGCADWDLYCTGDPAESSQVNNNSIHLSKNSTNAPTFSHLHRKERQTTPMLPPDMNYGVASFWVGLSLCRIPIQALQGLEGLPKIIASFQRWTPWPLTDQSTCIYSTKSKLLSSHTVGWKYVVPHISLLWLDGS